MKTKRCNAWGRRDFLRGLMAAGGTGLLGISSKTIAAGAPPETTTIRLIFDPNYPELCFAPILAAKEFLHIEGFTEVHYIPYG